MRVGPMELVIILVIALIIFGPGKLPEVGRAIGKGMRDFKEALSGGGAETASSQPSRAAATRPAAPIRPAEQPGRVVKTF